MDPYLEDPNSYTESFLRCQWNLDLGVGKIGSFIKVNLKTSSETNLTAGKSIGNLCPSEGFSVRIDVLNSCKFSI